MHTDATTSTLACDSSRTGLLAVLIAPATTGRSTLTSPAGTFTSRPTGSVAPATWASPCSTMTKPACGPRWCGWAASSASATRSAAGLSSGASSPRPSRSWCCSGAQNSGAPSRSTSSTSSTSAAATRGWPRVGRLRRRQTRPRMLAWSGIRWSPVTRRCSIRIQRYAPPSMPAQTRSRRSGLPLAVHDYGALVSVRLQRATLQLWKTDMPWAAAGTVVVGNGGDVAKEAGLWPAEATVSTAAPADASRSRLAVAIAGWTAGAFEHGVQLVEGPPALGADEKGHGQTRRGHRRPARSTAADSGAAHTARTEPPPGQVARRAQ